MQLKAAEHLGESLATQIKAQQVEVQRLQNENAKQQVSLHKLREADAQLKESREEILAANIARQAVEDEKAILQGACDRPAARGLGFVIHVL